MKTSALYESAFVLKSHIRTIQSKVFVEVVFLEIFILHSNVEALIHVLDDVLHQ